MAKYKRGLTFGGFDVFHKGHYNLLIRAKKLCDELYVSVSDDDYIYKHKGHFPVWHWRKRADTIEYATGIESMYIQHQGAESSKAELVKKYVPDVLIVGDDWTPETYTGEGLGVPVEYLSYTKDISTTLIRDNVQHRLS